MTNVREPTIHFTDRIVISHSLWKQYADGLNALIHWLDGYEAARPGSKAVPGHFELVMHYRELLNDVGQVQRQREKAALEQVHEDLDDSA